jgi:phosphotriesterase-related protein
VCIDSFGHDWEIAATGFLATPDWYFMGIVFALDKEGYTKQIVLGNDVFLKMETRRGGGHGYTRLPSDVIPALRAAGMSEEETRQIMVGNPARILAVQQP